MTDNSTIKDLRSIILRPVLNSIYERVKKELFPFVVDGRSFFYENYVLKTSQDFIFNTIGDNTYQMNQFFIQEQLNFMTEGDGDERFS